MANLRVVVSGTGFMGREVLAAVAREADLEPVGVLEKFSPTRRPSPCPASSAPACR